MKLIVSYDFLLKPMQNNKNPNIALKNLKTPLKNLHKTQASTPWIDAEGLQQHQKNKNEKVTCWFWKWWPLPHISGLSPKQCQTPLVKTLSLIGLMQRDCNNTKRTKQNKNYMLALKMVTPSTYFRPIPNKMPNPSCKNNVTHWIDAEGLQQHQRNKTK